MSLLLLLFILASFPVANGFPGFLHSQSPYDGNSFRIESVANTDTLRTLPFWDDFSQSHGVPDSTLWVNSENVYINNSFPINPPTQNVASFDGVDKNGSPYQESATFSGLGDELVSRPIDLSTVPESRRSSVFLSFFWQSRGLGEIPDDSDSLRLQFYAADSTWVTQDINEDIDEISLLGGPSSVITDSNGEQTFTQVLVQIFDEKYFHEGFRFRFQSFSSVSGIYDSWHLDYIYLNQDRSFGDTEHLDRSFSNQASSPFYPYYEISMDEFRANPSKYIENSFGFGSNLSDLFYPMEISHTLTNELTGESISSGFELKGQQSPNEYGRRFSGLDVSGLDFSGDSMLLTSRFIYKSGDKNLFEVVGSNNDTLFLSTDLRINDTLTQTYFLKNYLAYDDGTAEFAAGVNLIGGELAVRFILEETTRLTDILIHFPSINPSSVGETIDVKVWKELEEGSFSVRQLTGTIEAKGRNEFQKFTLSTPIVLSDTFYIGFRQYTNNYVGVGVDRNNLGGASSIYSKSLGNWQQNDRIEGSLMIRPVFNKSDTVLSVSEKINHLIFPNPAPGGRFQIQGKHDRIELYNLNGNLVFSSPKQSNYAIPNIRSGLYLLRIFYDNRNSTQKLIIKNDG